MKNKIDEITINNPALDRRVKLNESNREEIRTLYCNGVSMHKLSSMFGVSRRLIGFVLFPERLEECKKRLYERGSWILYYDKERNTQSAREHRAYKRELLTKGLIKAKE